MSFLNPFANGARGMGGGMFGGMPGVGGPPPIVPGAGGPPPIVPSMLRPAAPGLRAGGYTPPTPIGNPARQVAPAQQSNPAQQGDPAQQGGPSLRDLMLAGAGAFGRMGGGMGDGLPTAPMVPMQINPLNPLYDFERFRFNFGNQQGLLG